MSLSQGDLPPQQTTTKDTLTTSSFVVTTPFVSSSSSSSYSSSPYPTSTNSIGNGGGGDGGGNGGGRDGNDPVPKNASYFFGFLVTFVILLLSFVGCGFGSRRARRGAAGRFRLDDDDGDGVDGATAAAGAQRGGRRRRKIGIGDKPVLWDAWIAEQKGAAELSRGVGTSAMMTPVMMSGGVGERLGWFGIEKPISAMFVHLPDPSVPASLEKPVPPPPPTMTSAATIMALPDRPSFWASYLHATVMRSHRHVHPTTTPTYRPEAGGSSSLASTSGAASGSQGAQSDKAACEPEASAAVPDSPPPPEEVQLSVMIAMPCPPHLRHPHSSSTAAYGGGNSEERELGEYQFGVLRVPWDHEHDHEDTRP